MSDKETRKKKTEAQEIPEAQEKAMTKYDRKMQRRQEEKAREEKEKRISIIVGVAVAAAVVILVAYFPIQKYMASHGTYVTIGGDNITRAEFDYNYNVTRNNYVSQYGEYLSYFGLDITGDLSKQMYTENLTWKDFFEEMTVGNMTDSRALRAAADAAGFKYDASGEIENFENSVKESAAAAGISVKDYLRQLYGNYATMGNVTSYLADSLRENAYYQQVADGKVPSDTEIQAYYDEHTDSYDSVDFYQTIISAELPEDPTEEDTAKAMEAARKQAEEADAKAGDLRENVTRSGASYVISDWLFDEARQEGDTTVIEYEAGNSYYVLSFVKRYLDETPTADLRVIITEDADGQMILDEWKSGAATEESFVELYEKYSKDASYSTGGGLIEGVVADGLEDVLADWIFDGGRAAGDTASIVTETGYTYVLYYVGAGDPEWKSSIKATLLDETMAAYMEEISAKITVEDKGGKLNYLKVEEQAEAAAESTEE